MATKRLALTLAALCVFLAFAPRASAQEECVQRKSNECILHVFNGRDGMGPGGLTFDADGNIYGATGWGGKYIEECFGYGCGTIFKLTRNGAGKWTESALYSFSGTPERPPSSKVVIDPEGNVYGMSCNGGAANLGSVFQLTPITQHSWEFHTLHSFTGPDGQCPAGTLLIDVAGNLYGATTFGGANASTCVYNGKSSGCGVVFALSKQANGEWAQTVLHYFNGTDGFEPVPALVFDPAGNLYGSTYGGGTGQCQYGCGTVFKLTRESGGQWTESVLHSFQATGDGISTEGLALDAAGNVYGSTFLGGAYSAGTVFELSPGTNGSWTETLIEQFPSFLRTGQVPLSGPIIDQLGNLYGTIGGGFKKSGAIYELSPGANGKWTEKLLFSFGPGQGDPNSLILGPDLQLYGTTGEGGNEHACGGGCGLVFELTP
jgi:uncharacterized repeat protein (TIGR03803 family)